LPLLRDTVAGLIDVTMTARFSALDEITHTSGASEAIFDAIAGFIHSRR